MLRFAILDINSLFSSLLKNVEEASEEVSTITRFRVVQEIARSNSNRNINYNKVTPVSSSIKKHKLKSEIKLFALNREYDRGYPLR
jgi:hypothetical protein